MSFVSCLMELTLEKVRCQIILALLNRELLLAYDDFTLKEDAT